ncbi:MAG: hypothetical protein JXJ19_00260 [Elusimicrobia bacterium]|nr:hypothetical protein [Elusimicrobiota bacterium]
MFKKILSFFKPSCCCGNGMPANTAGGKDKKQASSCCHQAEEAPGEKKAPEGDSKDEG